MFYLFLHLVRAIKGLYQQTEKVIDTGKGKTKAIQINRGVRHGCSPSLVLFT